MTSPTTSLPAGHVLHPFTNRERVVLTLVSVLCGVMAVWVARVFGVPSTPGYAGSILHDASGVVGLLVVGVTLVAATFLAMVISGRVRHDAALFCATAGLSALSVRTGTMPNALRDAGGNGVFITLLIESVVLFAFVMIGAWVVKRFTGKGRVDADPVLEYETDTPVANKLLATVTTAAIAVVLTSLIAQTNIKGQVLAAVGIASMVGAIGGYWLFPTRGAIWFACGPLLASVFAYVHAYLLATPVAWTIGEPSSNLARAVPLDFVSVGSAAAILGHWMARRWRHTSEDTSVEDPAIEVPATGQPVESKTV